MRRRLALWIAPELRSYVPARIGPLACALQLAIMSQSRWLEPDLSRRLGELGRVP